MEYATEIVNISKIEDGFFVGDKFCGTNLDVIIQFKITHIINTSGIRNIRGEIPHIKLERKSQSNSF